MTTSFAEVATAFEQRASSIIWATVSSVNARGETRVRVVHPVWERLDGGADADEALIGWVTTARRGSLARHLQANPHVSVAYLDVTMQPWKTEQAYADCGAEWVDTPEVRERVFGLIESLPPPYGFSIAEAWPHLALDEVGLLRLTPWRLEVTALGAEIGWQQYVWRRPRGG